MSFWTKKPPAPAPRDWRERAARLPSLFVPGAELPGKREPIALRRSEVGELTLPTGRIVTGDAIATLDFAPFTRVAPTGVFPVDVAIAQLSADVAQIAAVRIAFSQAPIASWELATGGTGAATASPDGTAGYTATLALLADAQAVPRFAAYVDGSASGEWWYDVAFTEGKGWRHACFAPDATQQETCVLVSTGEGVLASYWGLDAAGAPVALITDFNAI